MNSNNNDDGDDNSSSSGSLGFSALDFTDVDFGDDDDNNDNVVEEEMAEEKEKKDGVNTNELKMKSDNGSINENVESDTEKDDASSLDDEGEEDEDDNDDEDTDKIQKKAAPPRLQFDDGSRIMTQTVSLSSNSQNSSTNTKQQCVQLSTATLFSRGNDTSVKDYYEIDRLCDEVISRLDLVSKKKDKGDADDDVFLCRVALQFPDELLKDAPEVTWLIEEGIINSYTAASSNDDDNDETPEFSSPPPPLVFVLGDTTYGSCCPDEVAALHLNANILIHFGHACLSHAEKLPVLYSFGLSHWKDLEYCAAQVLKECRHSCHEKEEEEENILLLYQVKYYHAMQALAEELRKKSSPPHYAGLSLHVEIGKIPPCTAVKNVLPSMQASCCNNNNSTTTSCSEQSKCGEEATSKSVSCCASNSTAVPVSKETNTDTCSSSSSSPSCCGVKSTSATLNSSSSPSKPASSSTSISPTPITLGGLELPKHITKQSLSTYKLLYIGDPTCKQFLHIILQCGVTTTADSSSNTSCNNEKMSAASCWSYNPNEELNGNTKNKDDENTTMAKPATLETKITSKLYSTQLLKRRYYLTQKAKLASIYGILVGTLSKTHFRDVVHQIKSKIRQHQKTSYTFVVGKINVNKLANFAEVDCFVLVSCNEQSILENEREFHVPIITPLELDVALGYREWDGFYSYEFDDLKSIVENKDECEEEELQKRRKPSNQNGEGGTALDNDGDNDDVPFFSMISGKYESSTAKVSSKDDLNLNVLPGKGQVIQYQSEGAEFLKRREYKGLEANIGQDEAKAAVKGKVGIASNYGQR